MMNELCKDCSIELNNINKTSRFSKLCKTCSNKRKEKSFRFWYNNKKNKEKLRKSVWNKMSDNEQFTEMWNYVKNIMKER